MNKKILILIPLIAVMLMSACSKKVDNTAPKETKEGGITLEQYLDSEMTEAEQSIGFTRDTRRGFVEKYGPEKYSISYHVLSNLLFSFKYDQSPILDSDTDMYKNDSKIEVVEYESSLEDHHRITADYVTNGDDMRDTVILVHGAGENRRKLFWRTRMFLDMGYNVLQYDQRASGDNHEKTVTYGVLEKYDLIDSINYVKERTSGKVKISVFGSSFGGSAVINAIADEDAAKDIHVAILDCPMVNVWERVEPSVKENCPPEYVGIAKEACNEAMNYLYGFSLDDMNADNLADKIKAPVLVFLSEKDNVLNYETQKAFYDKITYKDKALFVSKTAAHCCVAADNESEYFDLVKKAMTDELFK